MFWKVIEYILSLKYSFYQKVFQMASILLKILNFFEIYYCNFLAEDIKSLKSWEQIKGAKKPVRNTSAKMFWRLGIKSKIVLSEKFLTKIWRK